MTGKREITGRIWDAPFLAVCVCVCPFVGEGEAVRSEIWETETGSDM